MLDRQSASWIKRLKLEKHPEGGYFKETYRSDISVNVAGHDGPRHAATAILYMLIGDQFSALHRVKSDEIWHHYSGCPLTLHSIGKGGELHKTKMGKGGTPQAVMKAGTWIAASLDNKKSYCLVGCTMSPGFGYRDWELGKRAELAKMYPQHKKLIEKYTL